MSLKKDIKKFVSDNIEHNDGYDDIVKNANLKKTEKEYNFMKKNNVLRFVIPCLLGLLLVGSIVGIIFSKQSGDIEKPTPQHDPKHASVIQIDVNPSISLVVNDNDVVLSVYGQNDDGKLVLSGEELVGLKLDVVIEKIIDLEVQTGYIQEGEDRNINITVQAEQGEYLTNLENKIKDTLNLACEKYDINETLEVVKETSKENLINRATQLDPTLNKEELQEKSYEDLLKIIAGCHIEKFSIPTEEIEKMYNDYKMQQIEIADRQATKDIINSLDSAYANIKDAYIVIYEKLNVQTEYLDQIIFDYFISQESDYQKALLSIKEKQQEINALKDEIAKCVDGSIEKQIKESELFIKESALTQLNAALEQVKSVAENLVSLAKQSLEVVKSELNKFYDELPTDVKTVLTEKAELIETKVNEAKVNAFSEFETKYAEFITVYVNQIKEHKQSLIDSLK